MLSENLGDRQANPQTDMDFWGDSGRSVYRPRYTIEKLKASPNFTHLTGRLAQRFRPGQDGVTLECRNLETGAGGIRLRAQTSAGCGSHQQRTAGAGVLSRLPVAPAHLVQPQPLGGGCKPFDARQTGARPEA